MKPPPSELPAANSRKWHNRRVWDGLGYLRVRSMGNPHWRRDPDLVVRHLQSERDRPVLYGAEEDDPLFDAALAAVRRYPHTATGAHDADAAWDEVLAAVDQILVTRQSRRDVAVEAARRRRER